MGLLEIGAGALKAATVQIQTTGNNIANASTPGYHRQLAVQSEAGTQRTGAGYIGLGVQVDTIQRQYDGFLERAVGVGEAAAAADASRQGQVRTLEQLFADSDTGLGTSMDDLRAALADLVSTPADGSVRTVVLSRAGALAQRITSLERQMSELGSDTAQRMSAEVTELNGALVRLAEVNRQILATDVDGHSANDLLDQRDVLIGQINQRAQGNAYIAADGTASVFTVTGEPLVVGDRASTFTVGTDAFESGTPQLKLKTVNAELPVDAAALGGGSIAGLMRVHAEDLAAARSRLGQMAGAIGDAFNRVQAGGIDASGRAGQPMFKWSAPAAIAATTNGGSAELRATVSDAATVQASDYLVTFDGTQFVATRQSDGQQTALSGLPQTLDGLTIDLASGTPQAGDRFMVRAASRFASGFAMNLGATGQLATAVAVTPQAGATNGGSLAVGSFAVTDPGNGNLTGPVTLTFNGSGGFDVAGAGTGNPAAVPFVAGQPISYNGWTLSLSGTPAAGDTITLGPTTSTTSDNRNARQLYEAVGAASVGGRTFHDAYADLVADVGSRAQQASAASDQSTAMLANAKAARDSVSGVNLDEEAARLLQFQQAYQAAAKLISTSQSLFASLIDAVNG
ncbi:MAG: flagellar hook-associated protein FlgK [Burkholderiaceae bacterium]